MNLVPPLSESVSGARLREKSAFSPQPEDKWVLFGAGRLGRKVLRTLRLNGIEPLGFIDNNPDLQGRQIDGLRVMSPADGAKQYGETAKFIITIFRGTGDAGMSSRMRFLADLGCRKVMTFLPVAWRYSSDLLPHYGADLPSVILSSASEIGRTADCWGDTESRDLFNAQLLWRLRGDFSALISPSPDQYFPKDLIRLRSDEVFVDCGAFDGDTLRSIGSNFTKAWAIEPDPSNASRLRLSDDSRVTVIECALGDAASNGRFSADRGVASTLIASGGIEVRIETLDRLLEGQRPTFIKIDIEGAEQAALRGAYKLLARTGPIVAVCVYHGPDDLWRIPLFLRKALPDHRLFLRSHQNDGFEVVTYAVPPERLR